MFPVLFKIGSIPIDTYYVVWFAALSLALRWSVRRMAFYGIDDDEGRRVIGWGFLGMLFGSRAVEYVWNFSVYWNDLSLILDLNRGGVSEKGAVVGALAVTLVQCWRGGKISFFRLCEVAVPPAFLAIALGRWGCFFAGCCVGIESDFPWALHFPFDAQSVTRHATQLYYSFLAITALLILLFVEKLSTVQKSEQGKQEREQISWLPILTPLGLIFYSAMRIAVDPIRISYEGLPWSDVVMAVMIPVEAVWFLFSWKTRGRPPDPLVK